jgi:hypothetical protein
VENSQRRSPRCGREIARVVARTLDADRQHR